MTLSEKATGAVLKPQTGEAFATLLTIDHPSLDAPIRVTDHDVDIVSRGDTFISYPFSLELPTRGTDSPPKASLRIDNVHSDIVKSIRAITTPPAVKIEVVLDSQPDTVEESFDGLQLTSAKYNATEVSADLAYENILNEPYPGGSYSPSVSPGLF